MPSYKTATPRAEALRISGELRTAMKNIGFAEIMFCGSLRRGEQTIGDLDVAIQGDLRLIPQIPGIEIKESGDTHVTFIYQGMQVNCYRGEPSYWGALLLYMTGPKGSTIGMRLKSKTKGYLLNQYGLFDKNNVKIAGETEESIYAAFGMPYKEPSRRGK
jgi:DNA polymerase (family 10)